MTAALIDGKALATAFREQIRLRVGELTGEIGRAPGLATVLVGEDPASHVYVASKRKACGEAGIASFHHELEAETGQDELLALVAELNRRPEVDGILVQMPLPGQIDEAAVVEEIDPAKDVDGLHPANAGRLAQGMFDPEADPLRPSADEPHVPCTPRGVIELLRESGGGLGWLEGANAVVIGRSQLVGRPLAALLLAANATVTVCHSRTRELAAVCRGADVLIAATGRARMVGSEWVKPGATVIDVGINRTDDGLVGDVDYEPVREIAGAITPVPGGVGPMTIAMLLANTTRSAQMRSGRSGQSPRG